MQKNKKFYFFIGTTTELIKVAPVMAELEKRHHKYKIITSGQTKIKFDELSFLIKKKKADIALGEKKNKSSIFLFLLWSILTILKTPQLKEEFKQFDKKKTYFIVHGDPVSSLIGAIMAKIYGLKLIHIESGLRSFNFLEPFPEEICRVAISHLTDFHFAPNNWSLKNLEKVNGKKFNTHENTMFDGYKRISKIKNFSRPIKSLKKEYFVLIVHRQEHVIFGKEKSKELIEYILNFTNKNLCCVFITHAATANFLHSVNFKLSKNREKEVIFMPRLRYIDFVKLLENSQFIITDGGTNQEEAYYIGLPCLLLRNYTERIEGLRKNVVLSKENKKIIKNFINNYKKYRKNRLLSKKSPSKILVDTLLKEE